MAANLMANPELVLGPRIENANHYDAEFDGVSLRWMFTPKILLLSSIAYLIIVKILHMAMKSRNAFSCTTAMRVYNVVQVVVCGYMTYGLATSIMSVSTTVNIFGITIPNVFALSTPILPIQQYFIFIHYLSKFLDFFDTFFICLRKKDIQLSFLHVYHHATIGPVWGLLLYLGFGGGTAMFGALLNSFVHVLMYTHYFVTSFGIKNPFKKQLTQIQIAQFYLCILHAVLGLFLDTQFPMVLAALQVFYHISMIVLFSQFFLRTFKPTKAKEDMKAVSPGSPEVQGRGLRQRVKAST